MIAITTNRIVTVRRALGSALVHVITGSTAIVTRIEMPRTITEMPRKTVLRTSIIRETGHTLCATTCGKIFSK
jgi:hypothetical protein